MLAARRRVPSAGHRIEAVTELPQTASDCGSRARCLTRTGRSLTLAYIDIDHFKTVNDRLGHAAGDAVLIGTGRTLATAMRDVDTVARIGGDEYMVLLPDTDSDQARVALGGAHRHLVEGAVAHGWDVGFGTTIVLTVLSIGEPGEVDRLERASSGVAVVAARLTGVGGRGTVVMVVTRTSTGCPRAGQLSPGGSRESSA